jgi:hypothetical protein
MLVDLIEGDMDLIDCKDIQFKIRCQLVMVT